ncbi:MAG: hypothetical protein VB039_01795 [Oscillospiraceae bacterium]|nr:hypothetical protein [Oscillospiraceae bacterium]
MSQLQCPLCKAFLAAESSGQDFANHVQESFEDDFEQLAALVDVVHFCFSLMDNRQFSQFITTLYSVLGSPVPEPVSRYAGDSSISDVFFWNFLNAFEQAVLFQEGGKNN